MHPAYSTLTEALAANCRLAGKGVTFVAGTGKEAFMPYPQLYREALRCLGCLQSGGVRPGHELVLQIEDNAQFLVAFWACVLGGIRAVPLAVTHHGENTRKLFRIWEMLDNPCLLTSRRTLGQLEKEATSGRAAAINPDRTLFVEELPADGPAGKVHAASPSDIAFIQFSSGSTGNPKGVVLTHANLLTNIADSLGASGCTAADTHLSWMPLTHDMGLIGFHLNPLVLGVNHFIMPTDLFVRRPFLWLHKLAEHRITVTSSPNFGYRHLLNQWQPSAADALDLSAVRLIFNGAEPISADLCRLFLQTAAPYGLRPSVMFTVYGLAEATLAVSFPPPGEPFATLGVSRGAMGVGQPVTVAGAPGDWATELVNLGKPIPHCAVRITGEDHEPLPEGVVGYVHIRGGNVTAGYYNNPEATREAIRDGWLNTGDLGFLREGRLFITGRAKDVMFVGGQNVYAHDLERVAEELEEVEMGKVAACGVPEARTNADQLVLFVLFKQPADKFYPLAGRLKGLVARRLGLEVAHVVPVRQIPKTTSGKVKRFLLAEQFRDGLYDEVLRELAALREAEAVPPETLPPAAGGRPDAPAVQTWIVQWLGKRLSLPESHIRPDQSFADHGVTSLVAVELAQALSRFLGREVDTTVAWSFPDIRSLAAYLAHPPAAAPGPVTGLIPALIPEPADLDALTERELAQLLAQEINKP